MFNLFFLVGENKLDGTDEAKFIEILTTCSHAHALNLSAAYKAKYGSSLEDIIAYELIFLKLFLIHAVLFL
jgi:hypothetical protein